MLSATNWKPLPELELTMARPFGKDVARGGCELLITAQLNITIEADGESACIPAFVQPGSKQKCLLGMNALPYPTCWRSSFGVYAK